MDILRSLDGQGGKAKDFMNLKLSAPNPNANRIILMLLLLMYSTYTVHLVVSDIK